MQIILRGPAAGYEAEHTARLFFPGAEKSENLPQEGDFVLAQSHLCTDSILLRYNGKMQWRTQLRPQGADPEYALCDLMFFCIFRFVPSSVRYAVPGNRHHAAMGHDDRCAAGAHHSRHARSRCG